MTAGVALNENAAPRMWQKCVFENLLNGSCFAGIITFESE